MRRKYKRKTKRRRRRTRKRNNLGGVGSNNSISSRRTRRPTGRRTLRNDSPPPGVSPHNWTPTAQANQTTQVPLVISTPTLSQTEDDRRIAELREANMLRQAEYDKRIAELRRVNMLRQAEDDRRRAELRQANAIRQEEADWQALTQANRQRTGRREVVLETQPQVELFQYPSPPIPQANHNLRSLVFPNQTLVQLPPTIANVNLPSQRQQIVSVIEPNLMRESPPHQEEESYCSVMG